MTSDWKYGPDGHKTFATEDESSLDFGDEGQTPLVRYGSIGDKGVSQWFEFHSPDEPIPKEAEFVSAIYLLTDKEKRRLRGFNGDGGEYTTNGKHVVRDTQDRCEKENRVLYPIHFEADEGGRETQIEWITEFIEEHLPVSVFDCEWFHSGSRSIHCHVPLFVRENGLDRLRMLVRDHDGELDHQIYQRKNQFRIPGVEHSKTGYLKTPIEPEWSAQRIGKELLKKEAEKPDTYTEIVGNWDTWSPFESDPLYYEPGQPEPEEDFLSDDWAAYNNHHFSPYANSGNGKRSIVTAEIDGSPFGKDGEIFIPCYVWVAIGSDREFSMKERPCPIKLSKKDYRKYEDMGLEPGHSITIIGGGSGSSRLMKVGHDTAQEIFQTLTIGNRVATGNVEEAHDVLRNQGFETGKAGANGSGKNSYSGSEPTEAKTLQMQAESRGIDSLEHEEQLRVACRLLTIGSKEETHHWFKNQLGNRYDREKTEEQLQSIKIKYHM